MARRSQHTLPEIKAMVLQAAETLVTNEGVKALTMRNIALEIGYTVGSIYMVVENMNDLILHVNARTLDALAAQIDAVPELSPQQTIEAMADVYLNYAERHYHGWCLVFEHRQPDAAPLPDWYAEKLTQPFPRLEAALLAFAGAHPDCGFMPELDLKTAARTLWSAIHGICLMSLNRRFGDAGVDDAAASIKWLIRRFLADWPKDA